MKQSLQLRLGQHLTMTPQLQQAIRLLQLSTLELQTEVEQVLESNLMLERAEEDGEPSPEAASGPAEAPEVASEDHDDDAYSQEPDLNL
jgi:RNA polymerase sigma-54 factor